MCQSHRFVTKQIKLKRKMSFPFNLYHIERAAASPEFGIYTGPVTVLDSGDSHLIELRAENNSIRLFGTESIQFIDKALGNGY